MIQTQNFTVEASVEQIEVTSNGMFGGKPDTFRKFIQGSITYILTAKNGNRWHIMGGPKFPTLEWFEAYMENNEPDEIVKGKRYG